MSFAPTRQSKLSPSADASRGLANPNNRIPGATLLGLTSAIQGHSLRRHWRAALVVAFLLSGICGHAQTFAIDWFTISGGGGSCTGGAFTVSATIGQPAANQQELTGGNFSVTFRGADAGGTAVEHRPQPSIPGSHRLVAFAIHWIRFAANSRSHRNELGRRLAAFERQRHKQIRHRQSAWRKPFLPTFQTLNDNVSPTPNIHEDSTPHPARQPGVARDL
jgi:hypothetical protein